MSGLLIAIGTVLLVGAQGATVWFEEPPSLGDPCTIVVVQSQVGQIDYVHPAAVCRDHAGVAWFGTFGRIRVHLYYDTEPQDEKRRDFELCLTSGLPDRIYIWWDSKRDSWSAISPPIWHAATTKYDSCRRSTNGTMDLFLEPPWAYVNYVSHVSWTVKFVDELPPDEQLSTDQQHEGEDT